MDYPPVQVFGFLHTGNSQHLGWEGIPLPPVQVLGPPSSRELSALRLGGMHSPGAGIPLAHRGFPEHRMEGSFSPQTRLWEPILIISPTHLCWTCEQDRLMNEHLERNSFLSWGFSLSSCNICCLLFLSFMYCYFTLVFIVAVS